MRAVLIFALLLPLPLWAETRLLMAEQIGCHWCAIWDEEIAPIYPKTTEGAAAPLQRYNIRQGPPEGITLARKAVYTPTFILVRDGQEVGRIEGYPGEDFFWGLLAKLLEIPAEAS